MVGFVVLLAVVTIAYFVWWGPRWARERLEIEGRADNFRYRFRAAQQEFYANDRDGNGIHDYWTGDVAGLHRFGLIDRAVAEADARPLGPLVPRPVPWNGYLFVALEQDENEVPPVPYAQVTDARSGRVYNRVKFAFCAYPAEPGKSGQYIYIINENGSPFRCPVGLRPVPRNWPSNADLSSFWSRDCGG